MCIGEREKEGKKRKEWRPHSFLIKLETEATINHYYLEILKLTVRTCVSPVVYMHTHEPFLYATRVVLSVTRQILRCVYTLSRCQRCRVACDAKKYELVFIIYRTMVSERASQVLLQL